MTDLHVKEAAGFRSRRTGQLIAAAIGAFSRTVDDMVYEQWGAPLRTDGQFSGWGKHEQQPAANSAFDWYHGARPDKTPGPYPLVSGSTWTHHNVWGQVIPVIGGMTERRVRCHVKDIQVWHLKDGAWVKRKDQAASGIGNLEGAYWTTSTFSPGAAWTSAQFRTEADGGHSFDLTPTTNTDGTPTASPIAHWFYSGFFPREPLVATTTAVAIVSRMRLIPDVVGADVTGAKFVGCFNGDLFIAADSSVGPGGANPAFSISRHKTLTGDWKTFGMVTGSESAIRGYPAMPFLASA